MLSLGKTISEARKRHRKTLHALSEEVGVSPALLSLTEQDKHVPPKELIVKLATVLGGDADHWCGLAGKVTPSVEKSLAKIAKDDPIFFRSMINKK
jgi:transcriptional regulator with XRE-family HTH domain